MGIAQIMTPDFPKAARERRLSEVFAEFKGKFSYVYVLDEEDLLLGRLELAALARAEAAGSLPEGAGEALGRPPGCLTLSDSEEAALACFWEGEVTEVPVLDENGRMLGLVKLRDLLQHLQSGQQEACRELEEARKLIATLEAVVENPYEGMVVVDETGHVVIINNFYLEALGISREEALGRHIYELTPHSRLPEIVRTGQAQFSEYWKVRDREFMIIRAPIKKEGRIIGALGKTLFKDMGLARVFAKKLSQLENDLKFYKEELQKIHRATYTFEDIIGRGSKIMATLRLAQRAARTTSNVLLMGESGTGKELFAHAIHNGSTRCHGPFIKVNCAAIPEQLLESELFGYAEGAFTGARKGGKPGKFELANYGTIFLDEIGDMSFTMQAKILRVIQEQEIERVGGTQPCRIDVRIIAATNRKLYEMVQQGTFRDDLFYRLNVMVIHLPALRERPEDLELLAAGMLAKLNRKLEMKMEGISGEAMGILRNYTWPGNVRELESILERTMNVVEEKFIYPEHLPPQLMQPALSPSVRQENAEHKRIDVFLNSAERDLLLDVLRQTRGNKVKAAKLLGIHRSVLYKKLRKLGLDSETLALEMEKK